VTSLLSTAPTTAWSRSRCRVPAQVPALLDRHVRRHRAHPHGAFPVSPRSSCPHLVFWRRILWLNDIYQSLKPDNRHDRTVCHPLVWSGLSHRLRLCGLVMRALARRWKRDISGDDIVSIMIGIAFGVIIGARLFYVLFYGAGHYLTHPARDSGHLGRWHELSWGPRRCHRGWLSRLARSLHLSFVTICDLPHAGAHRLFFGRCANFINGGCGARRPTFPGCHVRRHGRR